MLLNAPGAAAYGGQAPIEGVPFRSLAEVLRFDVTKDWVYRNWPRKSTGLADPDRFGVRVPLVTGKGMADLAGALTYYFDAQGAVQHITFLGRTADTTQIVNFLLSTYGFERVTAPAGEQLFQVKRSGRVQSELLTRPEAVLWSTSPHSSFTVALELERPGSSRYMPPRIVQLSVPEVPASSPPPSSAAGAASAEGSASSAGMWDSVKNMFSGGIQPPPAAEEHQIPGARWPN